MHNYAAEKAGLKICHTFCLAYMSMMTTLCAKAVGQMGNGMARKGLTYFPNRTPLRLNSAMEKHVEIVDAANL